LERPAKDLGSRGGGVYSPDRLLRHPSPRLTAAELFAPIGHYAVPGPDVQCGGRVLRNGPL